MAIKVQGTEVISDSKYGQFQTVNPGAYTTANRPSNPNEGDVIFDTDLDKLVFWNGTEWVAGGGGGAEPGIISAPTLIANNEYPVATLTATEATFVNATRTPDSSYSPWFKDDVQITGATGLTYTATTPGLYKYQERWVGDDGSEVFPKAELTIKQPTIAKPTVLAPANGAGVGDDVTYYPETSSIDSVTSTTTAGSIFDTGFQTGFSYSNGSRTATQNSSGGIGRLLKVIGNISTSTGLSEKTSWKIDSYGSAYSGFGYVLDNQNSGMGYLGITESIGFLMNSLGSFSVYSNSAQTGGSVTTNNNSVFTTQYDFDKRVVYLWVDSAYVGEYSWVPSSGNIRPAIGTNSSGTQTLTSVDVNSFTLSFSDNKAYDSVTGDERATIDEAFTAGTVIKGDGSGPAVDAKFSTNVWTGSGTQDNSQLAAFDFSNKWMIWWKNQRKSSANVISSSVFPKTTSEYAALYSQGNSKLITSQGPIDITGSTYTYQGSTNDKGDSLVTWAFKGDGGFLDIQTYNNTAGSQQTFSHNLGMAPGFVMTKSLDEDNNWYCYHKSLGLDKVIYLNLDQSAGSSGDGTPIWDSTDNQFTTMASGQVNGSHVAFLFADNPDGGIKCGDYESQDAPLEVNVGFKPGWVLIKCVDEDGVGYGWAIFDNRRDGMLSPNTTGEETGVGVLEFTDTGFKLPGNESTVNERPDGQTYTYIYVAIAESVAPSDLRGFSTALYSGTGTTRSINTDIDHTNKSLVWIKHRQNSDETFAVHNLWDTERSPASGYSTYPYISSSNSLGQIQNTEGVQELLNGRFNLKGGATLNNDSNASYIAWSFRAAPGFMDIVKYKGTGVKRTVPHNLESVPGMMIMKNIDSDNPWWVVYHKELPGELLYLNSTLGRQTAGDMWGNTAPTATEFTVGGTTNNNDNEKEHIAYLFADTPGKIKCGKFQGDPNQILITCGFKPAWVLIKCDATENWSITDKFTTPKFLRPNNADADNSNGGVTFEATGFRTGTWGETGSTSNDYVYVAIAEDVQVPSIPPSATLIEDANKDAKTMSLGNVKGNWVEGMTAVGQTELTQSAPDPDSLKFVGSVPAASNGAISTWGDATWSVKDKDTDVVQTETKAITAGQTQTLDAGNDITLSVGATYDVTVTYASPDASGPATSDPNTFKTASPIGSWTAIDSAAITGGEWYGVKYGNSKFMAISGGGSKQCAISSDGESWNEALSSGLSGIYRCLTYGNSKWAAGGRYSDGSGYIIASSTDDGNSWFTTNVDVNPRDICYGTGKRYVFVGAMGFSARAANLMYSSDAQTWAYGNTSDVDASTWKSIEWYGVTYGESVGRYVAVSYSNADPYTAYSSDGVSWNVIQQNGVNGFGAVGYGNGRYVAVCTGGSFFYYSDDGINWTPVDNNTVTYYTCVEYSNGMWIASSAYGTKGVVYSVDNGETWIRDNGSYSVIDTNCWDIAASTEKFIISGESKLYKSNIGTSTFNAVYYDINNLTTITGDQIAQRYGILPDSDAAQSLGFMSLTEQPTYAVSGYELQDDGRYKPLRDYTFELTVATSGVDTFHSEDP